MHSSINIIGAGLAGCEAVWQLAGAGANVRLFEMKPEKYSPAHRSPDFAELVCSNSLRSNDPMNAAGLLKEEMRALRSITMEAASETSVPAGKSLAVDREAFAEYVTAKVRSHPAIEIITGEVASLGELPAGGVTIVATGPLTGGALAEDIRRMTGGEYLYFYDSIAPIVDAASMDFSKGFKASRYGYGGDDYWNFPLTVDGYSAFLAALASAEKTTPREFESPEYFEGCLPIEVMAERGEGTLRHGPMKPFGLTDPRTGAEPYAVVQLRQDDAQSSMFNMVGFQTRMTWPEQKRVFRTLPGLEKAEFFRLGVIHRNTYINSPRLLDARLRLRSCPELLFAGQITGVEGYVESAATGIWAGRCVASLISGREMAPPPATTALGSLLRHVSNANHRNFQPMNANFGLMPIIGGKMPREERKRKMVERARADFAGWFSVNS